MKTFKVGEIVLREKIEGETWVFAVTDVFHLSEEEYAKNEEYNDTLGNYEPEKELPTNSVATITATGSNGDSVELKWFSGFKGIYPHLSKKGWTKGLFVKLNATLIKWEFTNA
jgi:hypothetical protein